MFRKYFEERKKKKAEEAEAERRLKELFDAFVEETKPYTPHAAKHPKAALFRMAWKRSVALARIYDVEGDEEKASLHKSFGKLATTWHYVHAPIGPYGKPKLEMSAKAINKLIDQELARLRPSTPQYRPLACIYLGTDPDTNYRYVGQTVDAPERRWKEHRTSNSGPFKNGARYARWDVIAPQVEAEDLNYWESYYIGYFDSYECGYNDNRGNDRGAYDLGCSDRESGVPADVP